MIPSISLNQATPERPTLSSLCLFFATGRTFTFRNVEIVQDNESVIVFRYTAMSDGRQKEATFHKTHVVGSSILT
jgi:hypothetical protein